MSVLDLRNLNRGCYTSPFSGVGFEFFPPGMVPDQSGILLHETGFIASNHWWNFPNTLSPFWRLYFNDRAGRHKVVFPNSEYPLGPDRIVLIPDQQLFHSVGAGPVPHLWFTFQVSLPLDPSQQIPILLPTKPHERQLFREIMANFTGLGRGNRDRVLHLSLAALHIVLSRPEIHWQTGPRVPAVARARRVIELQLSKPLNTRDLAREANVSLSALLAAFKRETGTTPRQYQLRARVRESARLLATTGHTIESIAESTGFPNRHYFTRVFTRVTGDSPAAFRRKHGSNS